MYSPVVLLKKQNTYKTAGNRKTLQLYYVFIKIAALVLTGPVHTVHGAWRVQFLHAEFIRGHKIIWRDKSSSSAASPTCLLSAFDHPWSNCPFPCSLSLSLSLSHSLSLSLSRAVSPSGRMANNGRTSTPSSVPLAGVCWVNSALTL